MATLDSTPLERVCKSCGNSYPLTSEYWHKDKTAKHGLSYSCKECAKTRAMKRHWDKHDLISEQHRQYYVANKDKWVEYAEANREHIANRKRQWRKNNPDKVKKHKNDSEKRNRKSANERSRRYRQRHPERGLADVHARRARVRNAEGRYTPADIELQKKAQTNKRGQLICWWCDKPIEGKYHIDHVIPLLRGGSNNPKNLVLTHGKCNDSKGAKLPSEWNGRLL